MPATRRRARIRLTGLTAVAAVAFFAAAGSAVAASSSSNGAQRLMYLLEYIGSDYDAAVRDGNVVNQSEYGEVLRLSKQLRSDYTAQGGRAQEVTVGLRELEQSIERRAPSTEVWSATRRLLPLVARDLGGAALPATPPNIANGRRLWADDCAPCHGLSGAGEGPASPDMIPPPTAFRGEWLEHISPRQIFNALSFGVDATAMPSFAAYSDAQRWDVAFFAMTLRVEFDPKRPANGPQLTLDDIAASSNAELLTRLREVNPQASQREVDYLRVHFDSPLGGAAALAGSDASASGLAVALRMQDAFSQVADRVLPHVVSVTGYVRDPQWSAEQQRAAHGDTWMASNPELFRYPGFRPVQFGTGFIIDADGYVLSCDHLVRDEHGEVVQLVDVGLQDQTHHASRVVGAEPTLDLAVIRVEELPKMPDATPLQLGDSDRVEVGHWLIALGDPPGPEKTFAVGVVSAPPERQCYQEQATATRLQSSLVVPFSGLGGPVVDIRGHVVGITVHQSRSSAAAAPADAPTAAQILPIKLVVNLYEALKVAQSNRSPWIGISVLELPLFRQRLAAQAQTTAVPPFGVYIDNVFDPSPAAGAGVRPGDFLIGLGGHEVRSVADFQKWLYVLGVGTSAELTFVRDGQPTHVTVSIEVRPESATIR